MFGSTDEDHMSNYNAVWGSVCPTGSRVRVTSCVGVEGTFVCGKLVLKFREENDLRRWCTLSLIWCAARTVEARPEKVIVNGLFVFTEFAHRRWTLGSDSDRHSFFPLWDEREGRWGTKGRKWPGCTRILNWRSWKNNTKGEFCVMNTIITPLKTESLCNRMHRNGKSDTLQLYSRKWNLSNDSVSFGRHALTVIVAISTEPDRIEGSVHTGSMFKLWTF